MARLNIRRPFVTVEVLILRGDFIEAVDSDCYYVLKSLKSDHREIKDLDSLGELAVARGLTFCELDFL